MIYTVKEFCGLVSRDLSGFINQLHRIPRVVSDREVAAWDASFRQVSAVLSLAMSKSPQIANVHVSTSNMMLEYKLPSASAWCDLVLLGRDKANKPQVLIIELKNWLKNQNDTPAKSEGLILHHGVPHQHPADQVKGYTEYCRRFHSTVQEYKATVDGCVYFTQDINLDPYIIHPNDILTTEYPLFNVEMNNGLADYITNRIAEGDHTFADKFSKGYYLQDRNILLQVAQNLKNSSASPFVLLDEQRRGFYLVQHILKGRLLDKKKEVIVVQGPPGSGKSAVAVNIWFDSVLKYVKDRKAGKEAHNVVFVTTSSSQSHNWKHTFEINGGVYGANKMILRANDFNPGMNGSNIKSYINKFRYINPNYVIEAANNSESLDRNYWRDYLQLMKDQDGGIKYKDNQHFLAVVDEAHALINPNPQKYASNKPAGWCVQMGPQVYHIIRASQVSIFFLDSKQSFRDNETTNIDDIKRYADELDATFTSISLEDMQFRCGGSKEYVDWVDGLFSRDPLLNVAQWINRIPLSVVDYPSDMEEYLRLKIQNEQANTRILSSYTRDWVTNKVANPHLLPDERKDFYLEDKGNKVFSKYWNDWKSYENFVQAPDGSAMYEDPLCEVGCPYVVRGFDYDYVGLLWLEDVVYRSGKWMLNMQYIKETANNITYSRAMKEQIAVLKDKGRKKVTNKDITLVNTDMPATAKLFQKVTEAYRILLTRATKGNVLYIKDEETRNYIKQLINQES